MYVIDAWMWTRSKDYGLLDAETVKPPVSIVIPTNVQKCLTGISDSTLKLLNQGTNMAANELLKLLYSV